MTDPAFFYESNTFHKYKDIKNYHKQSYQRQKLNKSCEHIIKNGTPTVLTQLQKEELINKVTQSNKKHISYVILFSLLAYIIPAGLIQIFMVVAALGFCKFRGTKSPYIFFIAGAVLLLIIICTAIFLCVFPFKKSKNKKELYLTAVREKLLRDNYWAYTYKIEDIYRIKTYDVETYDGYIYHWYRVGDVVFELPDTTFKYKLVHNNMSIQDLDNYIKIERKYPIGGCFTGILMNIEEQEFFFLI